MSRILLVRHGRSAHGPRGWLDAAGVDRWLAAYDAAGIAPDDRPPEPLRAVAERAGLVVASDLPRARASAERLAPSGRVLLSPLLREINPSMPAFGRVPLPLACWALAVGARAAYRTLRRTPPPASAREQGAAAATWLVELAERRGVVLAVTHANVRGHIAAALGAAGWRREPGGRRFAHWSAWTFHDAAGGAPRTPPQSQKGADAPDFMDQLTTRSYRG